MNLRDLENILLTMGGDVSVASNPQCSSAVNCTINELHSLQNLSMTISMDTMNDACKNLLTQKVYEFETFLTQAALMRFNEIGLNLFKNQQSQPSFGMNMSPMGSVMAMQMQPMQAPVQIQPQFIPPPVQQPQYVQPQPQPQYIQPAPQIQQPQPQPPVQPVIQPAPAPIAAAPVAPVPAPAVPMTPPVVPQQNFAAAVDINAPAPAMQGAVGIGGSLPGLGGGNDGPAEGRDYLLSIINGEG